MIFYTHPEDNKKTTQEHVLEWNKIELSNERTLVGLKKKGIILPNYIRIIISHYKDPYKPTRIQWNIIRFFFFCGSIDICLTCDHLKV